MVKVADYDARGWDVIPAFTGAAGVAPALFAEIRDHPLRTGESGWGTRNLLHALILSTRPKTVLEVGAHIGSASVVIGSALKANGFGCSYHLEPQPHFFEALARHLKEADLWGTAIPLLLLSTDPLLPQITGSDVDLIFLDANHDYSHVMNDLRLCDSVLSDKGIILLDDVAAPHSADICGEGKGGVRQALLDFVAERPDYTVLFLEPPFWLNPCGLALLARKPAA